MKALLRLSVLTLAGLSASLAVDPLLVNLAMPDARAAAGLDVARAATSPLGRFLLAEVSPYAEQDWQRLKEATGLDPRYDLREIFAAAPGGPTDPRRIVAAGGTFDAQRISQLARARGAEVIPYQGADILYFGAKGSRPAAMVFLGNGLAAAGDPDSVRLAVDRHRRGGPALNPELAGLIESWSAVHEAWFVSLIPGGELVPPGRRAPGAAVLRTVQRAAGGAQLGDIVVGAAELTAQSAQDAAALADVMRLLSSLPGSNRRDPRAAALAELLQALEVSASGQTVRLRLAIPEPRLEDLILLLRTR